MLRDKTIKRPATHVYIADPDDPAVCVAPDCGLPERNSVHTLPTTTDEQAAEEARRLGENRGDR